MDTAVVLLVLAGVAVGVFLFVNGRKHKTDPAPAAKVPDMPPAVAPMVVSADPALQAALQQAIDKLHQSSPVPAPPAPSPPRPDPAALEPVRPTPVASPPGTTPSVVPQPSAAVLYPATHNWGDWRDVMEGESPEAYFRRTGLAGYGRTTAELKALDDARVAKTEFGKMAATAMATGPFDPRSMTDDDLYYICRHASEMTFDPRQLMRGLFYGPDVGRTGSQKFGDGSAHYDVVANEPKVRPDVVQAIREMARGAVLPWMAQAFVELGDTRPGTGWRDQHLQSWYDGWRRLHPGQNP